jgi:hypothetical protein
MMILGWVIFMLIQNIQKPATWLIRQGFDTGFQPALLLDYLLPNGTGPKEKSVANLPIKPKLFAFFDQRVYSSNEV